MILQRIEKPDGTIAFESPDGEFTLRNMHTEALECYKFGCVVHFPTETDPANVATPPWTYNWREDRAIMERICPHDIGHPDYDAAGYERRSGGDSGFHACDGCCA